MGSNKLNLKKNIVLVDDNDIFNFIMKKLIQNVDAEHNVHTFTYPEEAIDRLAEIKPDIIFLDLNMPILDGWDFLDGMQERNLNYKTYILSSSTSEVDIQRSAIYKNVTGYLTKPVAEEKLAEILQKD